MKILASRSFPVRMESLAPSLAFVLAQTGNGGLDKKRTGEIELCLEEVLVNIINYAYPGGSGDMQITCSLAEDDTFVIEVVDRGIPFDVLTVEDPDIKADINERRIGGLGIFFVKQLMDDVLYRRENDENILTLFIRKNR